MPYAIRKSGNRFAIIKKDTGKVVGYSDTREDAEASVRARYMGDEKKGMGKDHMMKK